MSNASPKYQSRGKESNPPANAETQPALSICIMSVEHLYAQADSTFSVRICLGDWNVSTKLAPVDEEGCVIWKTGFAFPFELESSVTFDLIPHEDGDEQHCRMSIPCPGDIPMRFSKDRRIQMSDGAIINVRYRLQNPPEDDWDSLHVLVRRLENLTTVDPPQEAQQVALSLRIEREPKQFCEIAHDAWNSESMEINGQVIFAYDDQMNLRIRLESDGLAVGHACVDLWASVSNAVQNVSEEKVPLRTWAGELLGWLYVALKFLKNMSVGILELSEFDVDVEAICYRFQNDNAELSDIRPHLRKIILELDQLLEERQNMPDEESDILQLDRMDNEAQILRLVEFGKRLAASRRVRYVKRDSPWPDPYYKKTLRYYPPKPYCACDEFCDVKKQLTSTDRTDEYETIRQELLRRRGRSEINKNSDVI